MTTEDHQDMTSHPGTLTCLVIIVFDVLTLGIWRGITIFIEGLIIKDVIKTLEESLHDHKTSFMMTLTTDSICHFLHYSGPTVDVKNAITMSI